MQGTHVGLHNSHLAIIEGSGLHLVYLHKADFPLLAPLL